MPKQFDRPGISQLLRKRSEHRAQLHSETFDIVAETEKRVRTTQKEEKNIIQRRAESTTPEINKAEEFDGNDLESSFNLNNKRELVGAVSKTGTISFNQEAECKDVAVPEATAVQISINIFLKLAKEDFKQRELKILLAIFSQTLGQLDKMCDLSATDFEEKTDIPRCHVPNLLKKLVQQKILKKETSPGGKTKNRFAINQEYFINSNTE